MKKINKFKDGWVNLNAEVNSPDLTWSFTTPENYLLFLQYVNCMERQGVEKEILIIPYLSAGRYDRQMENYDCLGLEVAANIINSGGFKKVLLFEPHSDVSTALIKNCTPFYFTKVLKEFDFDLLIIPDAGGSKRVKDIQKPFIQCIKERTENGLKLKVLEPEKVEGLECVIYDDLCDGGRTFQAIAEQVKPFNPKSLTLVVAHGLFTFGFDSLKLFDKIITTDSFDFNIFNQTLPEKLNTYSWEQFL